MASHGRHCLVIGVGPGTGLALVRHFAANGYNVSMIARHAGRLESWESEIPGTKGYAADIGETADFVATLRAVMMEVAHVIWLPRSRTQAPPSGRHALLEALAGVRGRGQRLLGLARSAAPAAEHLRVRDTSLAALLVWTDLLHAEVEKEPYPY